jgi:hypothetical protein
VLAIDPEAKNKVMKFRERTAAQKKAAQKPSNP